MNDADGYLPMKMRIKTLGIRITALANTTENSADSSRVAKLGELHELEGRHKDLEERLRQICREGQGLRQDVKADLSLLADNIEGGLDSLMFSVDAHFGADENARSGRQT